MATIKSFTDLSQSKVLAKILPLESADMCCFQNPNGDINYYGFPFLQGNKASNPIPCWSLAALLDVLPSATLDSSDDHYYRVRCNEKFSEWHNNPIDTCVEMIDRLHEQMIYDFNNS